MIASLFTYYYANGDIKITLKRVHIGCSALENIYYTELFLDSYLYPVDRRNMFKNFQFEKDVLKLRFKVK